MEGYKGPLFVDFRLPAAWRIQDARPGGPVTPEQVVVDDVGRMASEPFDIVVIYLEQRIFGLVREALKE